MKKFALATLAGTALLQFGGCFQVILSGVFAGFGVSLVSQLLPLSVNQV